jgi:hypothetical protein
MPPRSACCSCSSRRSRLLRRLNCSRSRSWSRTIRGRTTWRARFRAMDRSKVRRCRCRRRAGRMSLRRPRRGAGRWMRGLRSTCPACQIPDLIPSSISLAPCLIAWRPKAPQGASTARVRLAHSRVCPFARLGHRFRRTYRNRPSGPVMIIGTSGRSGRSSMNRCFLTSLRPAIALSGIGSRDCSADAMRLRCLTPQVPGRATSVSLEVMNSSSTGTPSCVFWMPRLIAPTISSGLVTRSP